MDFISIAMGRDAERKARAQRPGFARLIRVDETRVTSPNDVMYLHRVQATAAERSEAFDAMVHDHVFNRLFKEGAIYIERAGP